MCIRDKPDTVSCLESLGTKINTLFRDSNILSAALKMLTYDNEDLIICSDATYCILSLSCSGRSNGNLTCFNMNLIMDKTADESSHFIDSELSVVVLTKILNDPKQFDAKITILIKLRCKMINPIRGTLVDPTYQVSNFGANPIGGGLPTQGQ